MGMALTAVHHARGRQADLRPRPTTRWRSASASTASRAATASRSGPPHEIVERLATRDRRGPAVRVRRQRARVRQRHGRHAADRAVHRLPRAAHASSSERGIAITRNLVGNYITVAGDGRLLDHAAQARRRADAAVGRARPHPGAAVGSVSTADATVRDWIRRYADVDRRAPRRARRARHGDRRRRPRRRTWTAACRRRSRSSTAREGADIGALLKTVAHDADLDRRRRGRPAVRHAVPADGHGGRRQGASSTSRGWAAALEAGVEGVQARGKAEPGDKTMVDALLPAVEALRGRRRRRRGALRRRPTRPRRA